MTTISDVARAAGVSPATVSRVFNQPDLVTPDKRDRVLEAVRDLDYKPSTAARHLRTGAVDTITVLVGDISQPFHGALGKAFSTVGEAKGYRVLLYDLDHREDRLVRMLDDLKTSDAFGVVLATATDLGTEPVLKAVAAAQARGIFVVSSSQEQRPSIPAIVPRYQAISHLATVHLATQGCQRMVFLGGGEQSPLSRERRSGFERACSELGFDPSARVILDGQFAVEPSRRAIDELFRADPAGLVADRASVGVVAINMRMAIGALQAAGELGLEVPRQMSIVCCEDIPLAAEWRPAVTTVGIDFDTLAEATFASLLAGKAAPPVTYLPHRLIVRASSQRQLAVDGRP